MKPKMTVAISNISNKAKRRNFEIEDMSKPSEEDRLANLKMTQRTIDMAVGKKTEAAYVSSRLAYHIVNFV